MNDVRMYAWTSWLVASVACSAAVEDPLADTSTSAASTGEPEDELPSTTTGPMSTSTSSDTDSDTDGNSDTIAGSGDTTGLDPGTESQTESDGSSTTGPASSCDSPLLDPQDRLQLQDAPTRGNPDGWITIVQWTGYNDPFSRAAHTTMNALQAGPLGPEIRLVAKQFPLSFQDPDGRIARAALAADLQDGFWQLHDAMFEYEGTIDETVVDELAAGLGLDLDALHDAMDGAEVSARLEADAALFEAFGGGGTPSFIINGERITGAQPFEVFEERAQAQLDAMQVLVEGGLTPCAAFDQRLSDQLP